MICDDPKCLKCSIARLQAENAQLLAELAWLRGLIGEDDK